MADPIPMPSPQSMMDDARPIQTLWMCEGRVKVSVGLAGVTAIECVREAGEMGYVPWFRVWHGDRVHERVNARYVEAVIYQNPDADPDDPEPDHLPF